MTVHRIANLETRLVRWMVGTVFATATLTVGILRLLGYRLEIPGGGGDAVLAAGAARRSAGGGPADRSAGRGRRHDRGARPA